MQESIKIYVMRCDKEHIYEGYFTSITDIDSEIKDYIEDNISKTFLAVKFYFCMKWMQSLWEKA